MLYLKPFKLNKRLFFFAVVVCAALVFALVLWKTAHDNKSALTGAQGLVSTRPVIILDAGHGGVDGGAVAPDGTVEKDINLSITLKLNTLLQALGYATQLTRDSDVSIHDPESQTIRQKKVSDLHNRTDMVNQSEQALLISIHQNKFPSANVNGSQLFYSPNQPESKALAQQMQATVTQFLQPNNHKVPKQAGTSLYMLYHVQKPAVLIECGFLSNAGDLAKLKNEDYQRQLAFTIACGLLQYSCASTPSPFY